MQKFVKFRSKQNEKMQIQSQKLNNLTPWTQKYRPNKLDEISYQEEVTTSLKNVMKATNLPHMLFYGPPGTGKTSTILAFCKELYGPQFYRQRIKQLNASDQRGIGVIRNKIKDFAKYMTIKSNDKNYPCPDYKIIILDQADLLTKDAQSALRRIIQDNSKTTRFCIICNYITKIIQPLSSRFIKFRFKSIPQEIQMSKLQEICTKENIRMNQKQLKTILNKGDLRQTINSLQTFHSLDYIPNVILPTSQEVINNIMSIVYGSSNIKEIITISDNIAKQGYAFDEIIAGLMKNVIKNQKNQKKLAIILEIISKCEENLLLGAIQFPIIELLTSIYYIKHLKL